VRYGLRRLVAQLALRRALSAIALGSALLAAQAAGAASEHPKVFVPRFPASQEHTEFVVEVNAKGQVTRVRSGRASPDAAFNTMTYGNALQVFIRTQDGKAIIAEGITPGTRVVVAGQYKLKAGSKIVEAEHVPAVAQRSGG